MCDTLTWSTHEGLIVANNWVVPPMPTVYLTQNPQIRQSVKESKPVEERGILLAYE